MPEVNTEITGTKLPRVVMISTHDYGEIDGSGIDKARYCLNGCGCWVSRFGNDGPEGLDPHGICPNPPQTPRKKDS
jgi:hypothetical protein